MRAKDLLDRLATKHSDDVFVPECKTGPSQGVSCPRMDAWAMRRSWANPHTYGYEIKVSRTDFLGDDKWHHYLPYCSHFFFVVAPGVCDPSETPEGCGLIVATKTGNRLLTKRKAPRRDITIPEELFRYVLMSRAEITTGPLADMLRYGASENNAAYWREWLEKKRDKQEVGRKVSQRLSQLYSENVTRVETELIRLEKINQKLERVSALLEKLGINPHAWDLDQRIKAAIETRRNGVSERMVSLAAQLEGGARRLKQMMEPEDPCNS